MQLMWVLALGCLAVISTAHPLADPTQETLVLTRSDDTSTSSLSSTTEVTTDEPLVPMKLTEMEVTSVVSLRYAHTAVVARVKNPAKKAQEANFRVLLPETAFISGFVMTLDGKSYKAYVKEKEEAKQIYDDAVSQGIGAAHVQAKARDSNQFIVSVHVEPSSLAVFNLTYEELLVRRNGVYNHAINLHPGALVPKLSVTVHIKEAQKLTDLRVPEIRTGNEIDATKDDAQNSKAVIERGHDDRQATITFTPDLDEQKRLMDIYAQKSKDSQSNTNRWHSSQNEEEETKNEGVLGQFVVQYDVERVKEGEILVNEGYFVHFFAPTSLKPLNKYVVFVLDTSGSMMDRKIIQLREAMQTILSDLNSGDYFSIVEFASSVTIHSLKEADQEPPKRTYQYYGDYDKQTTLVPPSLATPENIAKAKVIVSRLDASGGTNIDSALDVAVNLIHKRAEWGKKLVKANDTAAAHTSTTEVATTPETVLGDDFDVERMKSLEPIIIFLTDGDPTVGETNPTTIINRLTEKNYGEEKATIFSLAFGEDADRKFLRKLSLRNDGFMRHIYEAADAALQLRDFYRQVSSPLLADVKFVYPSSQVKEDSLTKNIFRTYYAGSEVVVAGKLVADATEITPEVLAFCGVEDGVGKKRFEKRPKVPVPAARQEYLPLERLWSYLTIKQLLDNKDASDDEGVKNKTSAKALELALKYEFVTPLTSLVVVKPNATKAVDAESVDKPSNPSYAFGAPLSISSASNRFPAPSSGHAYASVQSVGRPGVPGLPGAPAHAFGPSYAGQTLLLDSFVEAEESAVEDYDYPTREHSKASGSSGYSSSLSLRSQVMPAPFFHSSYSLNRQTIQPYSAFSNRMALLTPRGDVGLSGNFANSGALALDDDTSDYVDAYVPQSTPFIPYTTARAPAAPRAIEAYHLEQFSWVEPLLNATADALLLQVNGTDVFLKLTKDADVPRESGGDAACETSVTGSGGVCVYLTRCSAARSITAALYASTVCKVVDGYAGVCCSASDVDKPSA